jgi:sulfur-oxidizing protein SoxB
MSLSRREFTQIVGLAAAAGLVPGAMRSTRASSANPYDFATFGNARLLHFTDCHAQLMPVHFREPHVNIGVGASTGEAPHLVGQALIDHFGLAGNALAMHAFTYLDFATAAKRYGRVGGFAYLASLVARLRAAVPESASLLLDGGDSWQGSWTAYHTRGADMVGASNRLGVDLMTGHWEFTYRDEEVRENITRFGGEFLAQNIRVEEDALFDGAQAFDEDTGHAFKPWTMRQLGEHRIAVIGQAFPYTPIANPQRFMPDWTFGIREGDMQELVSAIRDAEQPDAVVLLSHNGMDVDLKLASRVTGIDAILGGHTHDGVPTPTIVSNAAGKTLVTNAGSNGKFLGVLDLDLTRGRVRGYQYRLLPIFANLLEEDPGMRDYIADVRAPHLAMLNEELGVADQLLYRRGNFSGTFDQLICDALMSVNDAQVALSPGFRWGTTVLPGEPIRYENVLDQTCITYPETYARDMRGEDLKLILEDVGDNLFNPDPYYQQGGDMVRVGGLTYTINPNEKIGHRISDLRLADGTLIESAKSYRVSGWATVGSQSPGPPVWEQVAEYLRSESGSVSSKLNQPHVIGLTNNPGMATYTGAG